MCVEGILIPWHISHSFHCPSASPQQSTFNLLASFFSADNLHRARLPTLLKALAESHLDRKVWSQCYYKKHVASKAWTPIIRLPSVNIVCVLTNKKDENLLPFHAKSRIVVLGNHKYRICSKSDWFAPVLCQDSIRFLISLVVEKRHALWKGNCKNMFCQGIFPPEEIKPPMLSNVSTLSSYSDAC